jgi:hypothetical protein
MVGARGLDMDLARRSYLHDRAPLFGIGEHHGVAMPSLALPSRLVVLAIMFPALWWFRGQRLGAVVAFVALVALDYLRNRGLAKDASPEATKQGLGRFFGALVAGEGGLERYLAPGARFQAADPALFTRVELKSVELRALNAAEDACRARSVVAGTDAGGRTKWCQYVLELTRRRGRWEVAAVRRAPWPL